MKRKIMAFVLCLAMLMSMAVPGTLATSAASDSNTSSVELETTTGPTTEPTTEPADESACDFCGSAEGHEVGCFMTYTEVDQEAAFVSTPVTLYYNPITEPENCKELTDGDNLPETFVVQYSFQDAEGVLWYMLDAEDWEVFADTNEPYSYIQSQYVTFDLSDPVPSEEESPASGTVSLTTSVEGVTIAVEGEVLSGSSLSATPYAVPSTFGLDDTSTVKAAYDIKILDADGNEIQPDNPVFVIMDASAMGLSNGDIVEIIHQHDTSVETTKHVVINGQIVFPVSGFSVFIVNQIGDTGDSTGAQEITGNSATNPYEMTVGDNKIFYNNNSGSGRNTYRGEWQVTDESMAIDYQIASTTDDYSNNQYRAPYIEVTAKDVGQVTLTYKYVSNSRVNEETFYIEVVAPADFYIDDQTAENGCLVPDGIPDDVTLSNIEWSRSDGQAIKSDAINEDGSINISVDRGGVTNSRDPITYTVRATGSDNSTYTATFEVVYGMEILNPSFENTPVGQTTGVGGNKYFYNGYPGLYWKTTAPGSSNTQLTQDIEIIQAGTSALSAYGVQNAADGQQFAELNAENFGALYQDILTTPGADLNWAFSHAGRTAGGTANNVMYIIVAASKDAQEITSESDISALLAAAKNAGTIPTANATYQNGLEFTYNGGTYRIWTHTNPQSVWQAIAGTYKIPEGQYLTRLFFASDTNANSSTKTLGNLIDAVSAGEQMTYRIEYYPGGTLATDDTQTGNTTVYTSVALSSLQGYLDDGYVVTGAYVLNDGTEVSYPGNVNNGLYIKNYGDPGSSYDEAIVLRVYLSKRAITVTKNVEIEDWANMTDEEKAQLISDGYVAKFELKNSDGTTVATAEAKITGVSSTGTLTTLAEFKMIDEADLKNGTYTVVETEYGKISGYDYAGTTYSSAGGVTNITVSDDNVTVTISDQRPTANVIVTNSFEKPKTADLTITKTGTISSYDEGQSFIFHVTGPDGFSLDVVINGTGSVTIKDLPIGTYTVEEITDWSWRYTPDDAEKEITLTANGNNTVSFANTRSWIYWLSGDSFNENQFTVKSKEEEN